MESNRALDENFGIGLSINADIRQFLSEAAKWAYFLSILGFIMVGFFIVGAIFAGTFMSIVLSEMQSEVTGFSSVFFTIVYLALAGINILPLLYLYRFARNTKQALQSDNQFALNAAFENLKSHYKFIGIVALVILGFYVTIFIFSIFAGFAL